MLSNYKLLRINGSYFFKRWKSKSETKEKKKVTVKDKALEQFDDFYKPIFGHNWPSIRLGLLCDNKYVAVLNNYSDIDRIKVSLENQGALNGSRLFQIEASKLLEKRTSSNNKPKRTRSKQLKNAIAEINDQKLGEEYKTLYSTGELKLENESSDDQMFEQSDRYIDPSISTSQLNEYVPATKLKGSEDWILESEHYSYYSRSSEFNISVLNEKRLIVPENLHFYSFEPGNTTQFHSPKKGKTGVSDYYLMDGGSILPVLALDIRPDDEVLDICAAPGGKSFLCLQTLYPKYVVCNDLSGSRVNRIRRVMNEFFYDAEEKIKSGEIQITLQDARKFETLRSFNKILVDVPCTADRHSVMKEDNNIFKSSRLKERIRIPEQQSQILMSALKLVSVGGTVVYSTCSLSPIQNDGVVQMALQNIAEETNFEFVVMNLQEALEPTKVLFKYANIGLRYGHLVVPYLLNNFGPTYFCKLVRVR